MSKWKPGQLVTINRHVYRVVKGGELLDESICSECDLFDACCNPCCNSDSKSEFNINCLKCATLIGLLYHFKKVI